MKLLVSLLIRMAKGERLEKATAEDYRKWFGFFFFAGLLMIGGTLLAGEFLDRASALSLWLCATVVIAAMAFGLVVWTRHIPAGVSLTLGVITWGLFVWLVLRVTHIL